MFKKKYTPEELGALIYESVRSEMEGDAELSIHYFIEELGKQESELQEQYVGVVMIACLFGAVLAIERSTAPWVCRRIRTGLETEFFKHLFEQGASDQEVEEWRAVQAEHFLGYFKALEGKSGGELPVELGWELVWNLAGVEDDDDLVAQRAALYVMASRDHTQRIIDEHEPNLLP